MRRIVTFPLLVMGILAIGALVTDGPAFTTAQSPVCREIFNPQGTEWAFCDTFDVAAPGGRNGELDDTSWSFTRLSQHVNSGQGMYNVWQRVNRQFCAITDPAAPENAGKLPPDDSFMCGPQFPDPVMGGQESNHWMEAFNDGEDYAYNSARINQPFDFAGRTGTLALTVDARTGGSHGWWIELWLTDEPVTGPHNQNPSTVAYPRNGIGLRLMDRCGGLNDARMNVEQVVLVRNYVESTLSMQRPANGCILTGMDRHNHLEVRVAQDRIELWGSDKGLDGCNGNPVCTGHQTFRQMMSAQITGRLPFTRGYWHLQHAQYNAAKFCADAGSNTATCADQTYHWDNIAFDGPVLPVLRSSSHPDAMVPKENGVNLGYEINGTARAFTFPGIDTTGATAAALAFNVWPPLPVRYRINGGAERTWNYPGGVTADPGSGWRAAYLPLVVSELRAGTNTVTLTVSGETVVSNLDLIVETDGEPSTPTPSPTATVSATPTGTVTMSPTPPLPTPTLMPTATATSTPTLPPTPTATATLPPVPSPRCTVRDRNNANTAWSEVEGEWVQQPSGRWACEVVNPFGG